MKRVIALVVALFASLAAASPAFAAYPPGSPDLSSSGTPAINSSVTLSVTGFCPDTAVDFFLEGTAIGSVTADASGNASITITAPGTPGTYNVTADADDGTCVASASLALTVTPSGLPSTGSNSTMPGLQIALMALLLGGALVGVAALRRRTPTNV
jgi:hypothetical protein